MNNRNSITAIVIVSILFMDASESFAESFLETFRTTIVNSIQRIVSPHSVENVVGESKKIKNVSSNYKELPYSTIISSVAEENGLDPMLIHAIIFHESRYDRSAVSSKGAIGLMQLMPGTAHDLHVQDSYNPHQNITGGASYYRFLLDEFGDHYRSLIAYNSGPGNVKRGVFYKESKVYAQNVIQTWRALRNNKAVDKEDN